MSREPLPLDRRLVRQRFGKAAEHFDQAAVLHREVARRMAERLEYIRLVPNALLDLGCGTGADLNLLAERYPQARRIACDFAAPMLKKAAERTAWYKRLFASSRPQLLCADAEQLPLPAGSVDFVWSNLMLQWLPDPLPALKEMNRVLAVDGLLMFSSLGPDTLKELRQALGEAPPHVHRFIDMHDIGDMLMAAGFAEPVMDMEVLTLTYGSAKQLFTELRHSGSLNAALGRQRGLTGRKTWDAAMAAFAGQAREGRLPATIEVVYGHAWKARPRTTGDGRAIVQFDPARRGRS
jgi:malonyl-CoA O-methyltransferase